MKHLKPYFEVGRPHCPFYGFNGMFDFFTDSKENQCGLITERYSTCQMEIVEDNPNWHECPLNTEENRKKLEELAKKGAKVFPREFHPPKAKQWKGIPLKDWIEDFE